VAADHFLDEAMRSYLEAPVDFHFAQPCTHGSDYTFDPVSSLLVRGFPLCRSSQGKYLNIMNKNGDDSVAVKWALSPGVCLVTKLTGLTPVVPSKTRPCPPAFLTHSLPALNGGAVATRRQMSYTNLLTSVGLFSEVLGSKYSENPFIDYSTVIHILYL
jgi:hypothetical protein